MNFAWSPEQRELFHAIGKFASQELTVNVIENDRNGHFDREAWKKCGEFGIQGLPVPAEYGGFGADGSDYRRRARDPRVPLQGQRTGVFHQCPPMDRGDAARHGRERKNRSAISPGLV